MTRKEVIVAAKEAGFNASLSYAYILADGDCPPCFDECEIAYVLPQGTDLNDEVTVYKCNDVACVVGKPLDVEKFYKAVGAQAKL